MSSTGSFVNVSMIPNYYRIFETGSGLYEHPVYILHWNWDAVER